MKKNVPKTQSSKKKSSKKKSFNKYCEELKIFFFFIFGYLFLFAIFMYSLFYILDKVEELEAKRLAAGTPNVLPALQYCDSLGVMPHPFSVSPDHTVYFSSGNLLRDSIQHNWFFAPYQVITEKAESVFNWSERPAGNTHIRSGGVVGKDWRELTKTEWDYLLNSRVGCKKKIQAATLALPHGESVFGMFIFPDDWKGRDGSWGTNKYSYDEWSKMMLAGAVFFPYYCIDHGWGYIWTPTYWENENHEIKPFCVGYIVHKGAHLVDDLTTLCVKYPESYRLGFRLVRDAE